MVELLVVELVDVDDVELEVELVVVALVEVVVTSLSTVLHKAKL